MIHITKLIKFYTLNRYNLLNTYQLTTTKLFLKGSGEWVQGGKGGYWGINGWRRDLGW